MTRSTQFGKFEVQTRDSGDRLVWKHLPTGKTYEFDETGEFAPPSINTERLSVTPQDLSTLSLGASDDGDLYYHNGDSAISVDGSSTSDEGYVRWDNSANEWTAVEGGGGGGSGGLDISDDGTQVVASATDLNVTGSATATDDGDGTATLNVPSPSSTDDVARSPWAGFVFVNSSGDFEARSRTGNGPWTSSTDAATVIQSLHDDLSANTSSSGMAGYVRVAEGGYSFQSTLTVTGNGFGLVGNGGSQTQDQSPTRFTATGTWTAGADMIYVGDASDSSLGRGFYMSGIRTDGGGNGVRNVHVQEADRVEFNYCSFEGTSGGGEGLRVSGSYNSSVDHCFVANMHLRNNPTTAKNINQWRIVDTYFNTENADQPAVRLAAGGNRMIGCVTRTAGTASLDAGVSAVAGADNNTCQRWRFDGCEFYGDGDPYFDVADQNTWNACLMFAGGTGPQFESLNNCRIVNSKIGAANGMLVAASNNDLNKTIIANNSIRDCNTSSGTAVIDIAGSLNNNENIITGNIFRDNAVTAEIRIDNNGVASGTMITNNYVENGIDAAFGGARQSAHPPTITGNLGHNPVGYSRATPSLPAGTGSANSVPNYDAEPVAIELSGGTTPYDPTIVDSDGSTTYDLSGAPGTVYVSQFGEIYFRTNVPGSWTWRWE